MLEWLVQCRFIFYSKLPTLQKERVCALSMCVCGESEREREMRAVKKSDQSASLKKLPAQHDWFGPWVFLAVERTIVELTTKYCFCVG